MALPKSLLSLLLAASLTGSFALSALAADDAQTLRRSLRKRWNPPS